MPNNPKPMTDEDFIEDCLRSEREIHPLLRRYRRACGQKPCRACDQLFEPDELSEDELCEECDRAVKDLERA